MLGWPILFPRVGLYDEPLFAMFSTKGQDPMEAIKLEGKWLIGAESMHDTKTSSPADVSWDWWN